jgi:hypothetical protein
MVPTGIFDSFEAMEGRRQKATPFHQETKRLTVGPWRRARGTGS